jgi:hypothetical protein
MTSGLSAADSWSVSFIVNERGKLQENENEESPPASDCVEVVCLLVIEYCGPECDLII